MGGLQAIDGGRKEPRPGDAVHWLGRTYTLAKPNGARVEFTPTANALGPFWYDTGRNARQATRIVLSKQAKRDGWRWLDEPDTAPTVEHLPGPSTLAEASKQAVARLPEHSRDD